MGLLVLAQPLADFYVSRQQASDRRALHRSQVGCFQQL
jgi:hypothetical protein